LATPEPVADTISWPPSESVVPAGGTARQDLRGRAAHRVGADQVAARRAAAVDDLRTGNGHRGAAVVAAEIYVFGAAALDHAAAGEAPELTTCEPANSTVTPVAEPPLKMNSLPPLMIVPLASRRC